MLESKNPEGEKNDINEDDYQYCFDRKNVYQRFAIVAAGPIFNLILAIIFFTMTYMNGIGGIKPTIKLQDNDDYYKIVAVNDTQVERWQDVRIEILNNVMNNNQILLSLSNPLNIVRNYKLNYNSTVLNKEGDIINLPPVDGVDFFVNEKLLFKAEIGETNGQVAVSLKNRL